MSHNPRLEVKPATADDIKSFYKIETIPCSVRALAFFYDGALSGLGGVRFEHGMFIVFSDILENVQAPRATILRCGFMVLEMARSMNIPLIAHRNKDLPNADRFLSVLGFEHYMTTEDGDFYICQDSS